MQKDIKNKSYRIRVWSAPLCLCTLRMTRPDLGAVFFFFFSSKLFDFRVPESLGKR